MNQTTSQNGFYLPSDGVLLDHVARQCVNPHKSALEAHAFLSEAAEGSAIALHMLVESCSAERISQMPLGGSHDAAAIVAASIMDAGRAAPALTATEKVEKAQEALSAKLMADW